MLRRGADPCPGARRPAPGAVGGGRRHLHRRSRPRAALARPRRRDGARARLGLLPPAHPRPARQPGAVGRAAARGGCRRGRGGAAGPGHRRGERPRAAAHQPRLAHGSARRRSRVPAAGRRGARAGDRPRPRAARGVGDLGAGAARPRPRPLGGGARAAAGAGGDPARLRPPDGADHDLVGPGRGRGPLRARGRRRAVGRALRRLDGRRSRPAGRRSCSRTAGR